MDASIAGLSLIAQVAGFLEYPRRTSLLSVSGIASSSLKDVRRVKLLLTVPVRWGSLCSTGLAMVEDGGRRIRGGKEREVTELAKQPQPERNDATENAFLELL